MPVFAENAQNAAAEGVTDLVTYIALHSSWSAAGDNEITASSYERQAVTWDTAADGSVSNSNDIEFTVVGPATVQFFGLWNAASASAGGSANFFGMMPSNSTAATPVMADNANSRFNGDFTDLTGWADETPVVALQMSNQAMPSNITEGQIYFIDGSPQENYRTIEASIGGGAITPAENRLMMLYNMSQLSFSSGTFLFNIPAGNLTLTHKK